MRDVRAFLMDASVVRVDEGEDIQIDEFAVLLHTDDVNNNGYPKCPTMLGRTTMRACQEHPPPPLRHRGPRLRPHPSSPRPSSGFHTRSAGSDRSGEEVVHLHARRQSGGEGSAGGSAGQPARHDRIVRGQAHASTPRGQKARADQLWPFLPGN